MEQQQQQNVCVCVCDPIFPLICSVLSQFPGGTPAPFSTRKLKGRRRQGENGSYEEVLPSRL